MFGSKLKTIILVVSVTILAVSLISYPKESFDASFRGLNLWWKIVFPSLLPFFIISEMLIGFGVVQFIGVLLEPFMRPVFKVPGVGGFVWAMGMASGNPAGAKYTTRLRQEGQLTQIEAERLVSFTNSSNPLFIFGAVAVGFFNNAKLGIILALSHYLGNICVGILMRFYGREKVEYIHEKKNRFSLRSALSTLHQTRLMDNRRIGKLLGDSVNSSIQTLLMVGGFIILFSVINRLLYLLHITDFLAKYVQFLFSTLSFPKSLSMPFIAGLFEITSGSKLTSQANDATLMQKVIITSFILAFSGFSIHAQVASILTQAKISFQPFFIARILHGIFAGLLAWILWKPVYLGSNMSIGQPINVLPVDLIQKETWFYDYYQKFIEAGPLITISALVIYVGVLFVNLPKSRT